MTTGTRGGSTDSLAPLIATDILTTGDFNGEAAQVVELGVLSAGDLVRVNSAAPLPVVQTGTPGLPTGAATETTLAAQNVLIGAVTETAPATDTASSGLNGRLQRIAQRLTSLLAKLPALGTAGSASTDVITVQGIASMTAVKTDGSGVTQPVSAASLPLPAGAATAAGLTSIDGHVDGIEGLLNGGLPAALGAGGGVKIDGSGTALPISAASLPLPSGAATETTLGTTNTEIGGLTETAPASDTASSGLNGRLQRIAQRLTSLIAVFNIGAGTEAAAVRVTLPTDGTGKVNAAQSGTWTVQPGNTANTTAWKVDGSAVTQPVSAASLPLPSGAATETTLGTTNTEIGGLTETAPASDTASSGLNGRLQRIAQRLTSVIALLPTSLGSGGGLKVDGSGTALPVSGTVTANAGTNLNTSLLALEAGGNLATIAGAVRAEDAASADGHTGIAALAVRKATPANTSGADGDYENLQVSAGRLWTSTTVDAALPAGANAIGRLAANSGVIIGAVEIAAAQTLATVTTVTTLSGTTSLTPGTAAANLGKAEDAAHSSGDVGVMALGVRNDAGTTLATTDGDYIPLSMDANGALRVSGAGGGTQYAEDAAHASGDLGTMALTVRRDTAAATATTDGDYQPATTDASGRMHVNVGTSALPTGASTAAKQPALGTAGTASADVITVQGVASGTLLPVGGKQVNISATPTCSTSAYTAGDAIGGLLTLANAARVSGGSGYVQGLSLMCKTPALLPIIELVLFNQTFTAIADNAAFNPSDADMANCIGVIPISQWSDYSLNSIASRFGLAFPFLLTGTSLFGQMVTRSAITLVSTTDLILGVQIVQD